MARRYFLSRRIEERSERGILIRENTERKRGEGKKEKERKERKAKEQNIFVRFSRKINYVDVFVPKRDSISKSIDRLREREREREWHFFADNTAKDGDIPTGRHDDKSKRIILKYPFHMDIPISCCPFFRWIYVRQTLESTDTDPPFPFQRHPSHPTILLRFLKIISRGNVRFFFDYYLYGYTTRGISFFFLIIENIYFVYKCLTHEWRERDRFINR